jgi:hypothetical protein
VAIGLAVAQTADSIVTMAANAAARPKVMAKCPCFVTLGTRMPREAGFVLLKICKRRGCLGRYGATLSAVARRAKVESMPGDVGCR